ncbi:hypothetical protein [Acinetobacter proteolyticus]|uniref:Uncharacterized protein n=1 Tax=Acinetobacter proteolyticus TaxID=1776741 RepID=A0A2N0WID5_9GAMM|nr:hypothetical protein [Acinetobacter proteolyticus]PKF35526.1 hypothetical protein CW311_04350 [Acinetobacter proteolyticus]
MSYVTIADTAQLVKDLKAYYGKNFADFWSGMSDTDIAMNFANILADVHIEQFNHGRKKMESSGFIPNMPQFKDWCLEKKSPAHNWLSAHEAWALCLSYENNEKVSVTAQAMEAFRKVGHVLHNEGQKPAFQAFKGFYSRIVDRAVERGQPQTIFVPPLRLKSTEERSIHLTHDRRELARESIAGLMEKLKLPRGLTK